MSDRPPAPFTAPVSLAAELARTRAQAQAALEEATAINEELRAANEQLAARQDELRAINARLQAQTAELEVVGDDLASLLASIDIAVLFLDPEHRVRRYTTAVKDLVDLRPADVGRPLADLRWKFADPDLVADAQAVFDRLVPIEREVACDGGHQYLRRVLPHRSRDNRVDGVVVAFVDVTERLALERRLRQAQKMEAFGQLAGGVAHDFNNVLQVINGYASLLADELPPDAPGRPYLDEVLKAGDRSAALTRQLLAFARADVVAPRVIDLCAVAAGTAGMLRRLIGEDVRLVTDLPAGVWPVEADPGQVEQVLVNLAVNARDAMPGGGTLTVAARNEASSGPAHPDRRPGPHAVLAVTDTGAGMTDAVLARAFEPFFTTKGVGRGTGLGLATVYGIARQAGGHVRLCSRVGAGTTVEVYLPRAAGCPAAAAGAAGPREPAAGTETVLVIEDDPSIRALLRVVLESHGYTVLEAADGDAAGPVAAAHPGPIHLVLSDVVMPGTGGPAAAAVARHPGARLLFVSGHTDDAVVLQGVRAAEVPFLKKPFTPAALLAKVRAVLDAS